MSLSNYVGTFLFFALAIVAGYLLSSIKQIDNAGAVDMEFRVADDAAVRAERLSKERFLGGMEGVLYE